jgi:radical SAM protein with 4Fe4S-binding SPASM domain
MLNISLNEFRAEQYSKLMGLPFERTVANLKVLHDLKLAQRANFPVHISRVGDGSEDDDRYVRWVEEHFPAFKPIVLVRGDWRGSIKSLIPLEPAPAIQCSQWFKLRFWADGKAAFCCTDVRPQRDLGDVNAQHVLEIYNTPERRRLRSEVKSRLEVEECRRCPMLV